MTTATIGHYNPAVCQYGKRIGGTKLHGPISLPADPSYKLAHGVKNPQIAAEFVEYVEVSAFVQFGIDDRTKNKRPFTFEAAEIEHGLRVRDGLRDLQPCSGIFRRSQRLW